MKLLIVYHSQSGTTSKMANAVIAGASDPAVEGVELRVREALDATPEDLLWCDGFILGTPENFGYMSGALKVFLDRAFYSVVDRVDGLLEGCLGARAAGAIASVQRILAGLKVREVQPPLLIAGEFDESRLDECRELGLTMAAGLEAGIF